ncbi:MAG TPA: hypothetical protein VJ456_06395 [Acidimicrobiia bacterium]|nr:hypothetical protein [Acidimicrobiia bacterium]HTC82269.1 hypothetical protein [Acidimicrobiia bacterium]
MRLLIVVTLTSSVIAGLAAYIVAYDRACACGHRGEAGRWALRAIPGPSLFFLGLGTLLGIAVPLLFR